MGVRELARAVADPDEVGAGVVVEGWRGGVGAEGGFADVA